MYSKIEMSLLLLNKSLDCILLSDLIIDLLRILVLFYSSQDLYFVMFERK